MASQPPSDNVTVEMGSFVRGYHSYMDVWEPQVGEVLVLEREPQNVADQFAVSVVRSGRISQSFNPTFISQYFNSAFISQYLTPHSFRNI